MREYQNGSLSAKLDELQKDVNQTRDDLSESISELSNAVKGLTSEFKGFIRVAETSIPIRAVIWLMVIMVLGLIGVEGVKTLGPALKFLIGF